MRLLKITPLIFLLLALSFTPVLARFAPQQDDSAPILLSEYWDLLTKTRTTARALQGKDKATIVAGLQEAAKPWQSVQSIQMPDGQIQPFENEVILALLTDSEPNVREVLEHLDQLLLERGQVVIKTPPADARSRLDEILKRPEFQYEPEQPNPFNDFLQQLLEWLDRLLGGTVDSGVQSANIAFPLIQVVSVVALAIALFVIFRSLYNDSASDAQVGEASDGDENLTSDTAFQKAQALSSAGDNRTAVRYLYLSSLLVLDERGLLRYDRTKTNREYLRSISNQPDLVAPLRDVIDTFDRVWYGFKNLDDETFQGYVKRVEDLREQKQE